jgi:hypothetical protein
MVHSCHWTGGMRFPIRPLQVKSIQGMGHSASQTVVSRRTLLLSGMAHWPSHPGILPRTSAGFTAPVFDDPGLRSHRPARPAAAASYPVLVHQIAVLLHASFRPHLTITPLRFANPSPSSGWVEDLHLRAVDHARHTEKAAPWGGCG